MKTCKVCGTENDLRQDGLCGTHSWAMVGLNAVEQEKMIQILKDQQN